MSVSSSSGIANDADESPHSPLGANMSNSTKKKGTNVGGVPTVLISEYDAGDGKSESSTFGQEYSSSKHSISMGKKIYFDRDGDQKTVTVVGPDNKEIQVEDIAVAQDGGWGWVVVFGAFMCNLILDGTVFSFGIIQEDIVNCTSTIPSEREPISKVAWVGSLLFGFNLLSGPFVSAAANLFGFRAVGMAGGIIGSIAFSIAYLSANHVTCEPNMVVLFLVYGVIGGIGFGLVYVPSIITVGFYFNKRRALATGIAISGSGCGTFIFAPLVKALIHEFEWHGTLLIQACLIFSCCIFCALFRPLVATPSTDQDESTSEDMSSDEVDEVDAEFKSDADSVGLPTPEGTPLLQRMKKARDEEKEEWNSANSLTSPEFQSEEERIARIREQEFIKARAAARISRRNRKQSTQSLSADQPVHKNQKKRMSVPALQHLDPATQRPSVKGRNAPAINLKGIAEEVEEEPKPQDSGKNTVQAPLKVAGVNAEVRRASIRSRGPTAYATSLMLSNSTFISTGDMTQSRVLRISNKSLLNKPLYRDDIFYAGSLKRVPEFANTEGVDVVFTSVELRPTDKKKRGNIKSSNKPEEIKKKFSWRDINLDVLKTMLDFSLLKSPTFLFLAISGFITLLGYTVPFVYLKGLASASGIDDTKATLLISIIGITNTIGRIVCGLIADSPKVNSLIINNGALTVAGIATGLVPFFGRHYGYPVYVAYSCIFGISMACFASLRSILLVELLGLGKLTNAFGLLLLFQGISAICGSPLGGFLYDKTGSYDITFYAAGSMMLFSGIMCYPLHCINNCEKKKIKKSDENKI